MKKFIRENPTIVFGLGLPLLLVLAFLLASGLPALIVDDPEYDLLYATQYRSYPNGVQISVVGESVEVIYQGSVLSNQKPKIWRYNATTGAVKEIAYLMPEGLFAANQVGADAVSTNTPIDVPDISNLRVDSSNISPDGYEFTIGRNRYSGNVFGGLFYSTRYRNEAVLIKSGRQIRVPHPDGRTYGYNTHFIGWVVSQ